MRKYSHADVCRMLTKRIAVSTQRAVAEQLDVPASVLCETLKGKREPGPSLVKALGLERIVYYVER